MERDDGCLRGSQGGEDVASIEETRERRDTGVFNGDYEG